MGQTCRQETHPSRILLNLYTPPSSRFSQLFAAVEEVRMPLLWALVAIDQLEFLLSRPGVLSVSLLRLDPTWDPLRDHPRFQRLLEGRL